MTSFLTLVRQSVTSVGRGGTLAARSWSSCTVAPRHCAEWTSGVLASAALSRRAAAVQVRGFAGELAPRQNARERVTKQMMPGGVLPEGYRGTRLAKRFKARRRLQRLDARRRKSQTSASLQARDAARRKRWRDGAEKAAAWKELGATEEARVLAAALPRA